MVVRDVAGGGAVLRVEVGEVADDGELKSENFFFFFLKREREKEEDERRRQQR